MIDANTHFMRRPFSSLLLFIPLALFVSCQKHYYLKSHSAELYTIADTARKSQPLVTMLQYYKIGVDTVMQEVIGTTDIPLTKAQPECLLGNFITDAQLKAAKKLDPKVVGSVCNYGGIRQSFIAPGNITRGKMYELMPFDNMVTIVEISGANLKKLCDLMAKSRGWPVSGISFKIKNKEATDILLDGKPVNDHIYYKVVMSDYIAKGGDNCDFLMSSSKKFTSIFIRDAMIDYVKELQAQGKPLHPEIENRVSYDE